MKNTNSIIKLIEFKYSGNIHVIELPEGCSINEENKIIQYIPNAPVSKENALSLYREIENIFISKLLLDDESFELRFKKWIVFDDQLGIDREIRFSEGSFTLGIRNFEAKPIEIKKDITFDFQKKAKDINQFKKEIELWMRDDDIDYMIDTYNIGLRKGSEELFYMYAVYDCVKFKRTDGDKFITNVLGLKKEDKAFINNYCNNENIRKSRHSGRKSGMGKDTGGHELRRLRSIIKELIIRYAYFINNNNQNQLPNKPLDR
jgi:hypothetical protein